MSAVRHATPVRLERKMCLGCGFDGEVLQGHLAHIRYRCPSCDHDLYARPPRSYAELEGLVPLTPAVRSVRVEDWAERLRVIEKEQRKSHKRVVLTSTILCAALACAILTAIAAM